MGNRTARAQQIRVKNRQQATTKSGPGVRQDMTRTAESITTKTHQGDSAMAQTIAPTQLLRNLIEGNACALVTADELHDALTLLEQTLHLDRTYTQVEEEVAA